tara:strand:+ start:154 stop:348 length:195 start_codon:yes stop_codon:yes gene_type:complete
MEIKDLTTDLERSLYVEIFGTKQGLENYFENAKGKGWEEYQTFKRAEIRLELLTELAKIIEDEK